MASSVPPHAIPSLRNVRDTYVNLLLSNGQQPVEAAPKTPQMSWTPGQNLGSSYKEHAVHWASPVTPGLTENEMRVAEVAANLVAAGDTEKRNKDAIRTLADKLEEAERRNRELEAAVHTEEKRKKDRRRVSYGDAKRSIHFTPRTPRRSAGFDLGNERRRSKKLEREWFRDSPFQLELENLRIEQARWHQEREKFRSMMSDIKKNTSRLLDEREKLRRHRDASTQERDAHLQVIARLQSQLIERKQREELSAKQAFDPNPSSKNDPMVRHCDDDIHFPSPANVYHQISSHVPVFGHPEAPNEENNERLNQDSNPTTTSNSDKTVASLEEDMLGVQEEFGREEELQTELHLVNQENIRVSERNAALEAENAEMKEHIRILETEYAAIQVNMKECEQRAGIEAEAGNPSAPISNAHLSKLMEEINILESISLAIRFEISPSEADRAQESLTGVGSFTADGNGPLTTHHNEHVNEQSVANLQCTGSADNTRKSPVDMIKQAVNRLATIRTDLCSKYGKWLEAVANDVSFADGETELESIDKENAILFDVESKDMDTKVINKLVGS